MIKKQRYLVHGEPSALVGVALHAGHWLDNDVSRSMVISEDQRSREEDLATDLLATVVPMRIMVIDSRFQTDLNRPPDRSVYLEPEQSWGIRVWRTHPSKRIIIKSRQQHEDFYLDLENIFSNLEKKFGQFVVICVHSYNQQRTLDEKDIDVDIGTWLVDPQWKSAINRFTSNIQNADFFGRQLSVGKNARFKYPAYFECWLGKHFPKSCCLSIEFAKQLFMTDDLLRVVPERFEALRKILSSATSALSLT